MTDRTTDVTGVLLAGGQSRRMGGGDKGLLKIADRPMLAHVIERLRPQVRRLVINANGDPRRFSPFGLPVAPDTLEGFIGPLAGVLAGMRWSLANAPQAQYIATASADSPFLPVDLVARLISAAAAHPGGIALAASGGELHPVIGLWPVALAEDLDASLTGGLRKVLHWTDRHGTVPVEFPFTEMLGRAVDPFFNANTPEELELARELLTLKDHSETPA